MQSKKVIEADETGSRLVLASMRNTYRVMDNQTARTVAELEASGANDYESYREHVRGTLQQEAYEEGTPIRACFPWDSLRYLPTVLSRSATSSTGWLTRWTRHWIALPPCVPPPIRRRSKGRRVFTVAH